MILHICKPARGFFIHIGEQKMILHTCGLESGFFIHMGEEKNDIAHLWAQKWFF
jgi:hypothetical protein